MPNNQSRKRKRTDWSEKLRVVQVIEHEFDGEVMRFLRSPEFQGQDAGIPDGLTIVNPVWMKILSFFNDYVSLDFVLLKIFESHTE